MMKSKAMNIKVSIVEDDRPARQILAGWLMHAEGFNCVGQHASVEAALEHLPAGEAIGGFDGHQPAGNERH